MGVLFRGTQGAGSTATERRGYNGKAATSRRTPKREATNDAARSASAPYREARTWDLGAQNIFFAKRTQVIQAGVEKVILVGQKRTHFCEGLGARSRWFEGVKEG